MHHRFTDATQENKGGIGSSSFRPIRIFTRPVGCMTWQQWLLSTGGRAENFYHPLSFIKWYTTLTVTRTRCYVSRVISHHFYAAGWLSWAKEGQRSIYLNGLVPWLQFYINFYAFSLDTAAYFKDDSWYRKLLAVLMVGSNSEQSYHATKDKWKGMRTKWKDYPDAII